MRVYIAFILLIVASQLSYAEDCRPPDSKTKLPHGVNSNDVLVKVCGNAQENYYYKFYFKSTRTVTDHVTFEETVTFGNTLYFDGAKFSDEQKAIKLFNPPHLNAKANCWRAKAIVKLTSYLIEDSGFGFDSDGTYIDTYTVVNVGKYEKCKGETT